MLYIIMDSRLHVYRGASFGVLMVLIMFIADRLYNTTSAGPEVAFL